MPPKEKKPRDDLLLILRTLKSKGIAKTQTTCTFTARGPIAELVNVILRGRALVRDICNLRSKSELLNCIFAIFVVLLDKLHEGLGAYMPQIYKYLREGDWTKLEETVIEMFRQCITGAGRDRAQKLYIALKRRLGDRLDKVLDSEEDFDAVFYDVASLIAGESETSQEATSLLLAILRDVKHIRKAIDDLQRTLQQTQTRTVTQQQTQPQDSASSSLQKAEAYRQAKA